jgi:hypothetical protein
MPVSLNMTVLVLDVTLGLTFCLLSFLVCQNKVWHGALLSLFQVLEWDTPANLLSNSSSEFSKMLSAADNAVATGSRLRQRT